MRLVCQRNRNKRYVPFDELRRHQRGEVVHFKAFNEGIVLDIEFVLPAALLVASERRQSETGGKLALVRVYLQLQVPLPALLSPPSAIALTEAVEEMLMIRPGSIDVESLERRSESLEQI